MGREVDTSDYSQTEIELWNRIKASRETVFHTKKGLEFKIEIKGNELFVDRRQKSITRASVNIAYKKWIEDPDCGPKALGVFGSSYLWSFMLVIYARSIKGTTKMAKKVVPVVVAAY